MKKQPSLSDASLAKIWSWCEQNPGTPLADAYLSALTAVGGGPMKCSEIFKQIGGGISTLDPKGRRLWDEAWKIYNPGFAYRDLVGRLVLAHIKRTSRA